MAWTLVTGGAKRLGADICLALAREGYNIVVHYHRSQKEAMEVVEQCKLEGVQADAIQGDFSTTELAVDFIQRYRKRFEETENIVHNVGNYLIRPLMATTLEEWQSLLQTNLTVPFLLNKELMETLIRFQGSIIHVGVTGLQSLRANVDTGAYKLTKAALLMLTRSLAKEMASQGVRVNMVSPGYLDIAVDLPQDLNALPMHRAAQCGEISQVIAFLLDRRNSYITGQNIEVAGAVGL